MTRADADNTELAASPGSRLRLARESHGLSEQQAAEALNLDPMVVTVLEANDFAALGAPVFVRGHLRRYAGFLGLPEEEFPPLPKFDDSKVVTIRQKDLRDGLRKTSYAISTDETRYVLNGVLFSFKDNKLTLVATDGRRLAMLDIDLEFPRSHEADIIVPTKAVTELQRLLTDEGDVRVSVGSGQIAFDLNNTLLVSKLIEGNYPNYKQVIPGEMKERVTLERETFLNSLRRVSLLASDKSNSIKLNFAKNNIDITANTPEVGEAKESLPVVYKGREFSIAFNPEFLMAPLRNLAEDEVFLDLIDEMSPGVIKIQSPFLYVLMPMRISS